MGTTEVFDPTIYCKGCTVGPEVNFLPKHRLNASDYYGKQRVLPVPCQFLRKFSSSFVACGFDSWLLEKIKANSAWKVYPNSPPEQIGAYQDEMAHLQADLGKFRINGFAGELQLSFVTALTRHVSGEGRKCPIFSVPLAPGMNEYHYLKEQQKLGSQIDPRQLYSGSITALVNSYYRRLADAKNVSFPGVEVDPRNISLDLDSGTPMAAITDVASFVPQFIRSIASLGTNLSN